MTAKKLIHGLEDDFLPTFRLWREKGAGIRATKKKKAGKMRAKTCIKGLGDVTIQNSRNTFFQSSV